MSAGEIADGGALSFIGLIVFEIVVGAVVGLAVGFGAARLLRQLALPASGLYPLIVLAFTVLAYGLAVLGHASGFAAVYLCALVLGNTELPHRVATRSFVEGIGWLAQIGLFVMLGLLASPSEFTLWHLWTGLVAGAVLTFVARPLSVLVCATWFRVGWREQLFVGWAGLRGAVPIILATIPLAADVPGSRDLFDIVFVAVVVYTLVQAAPLARLARWCGVLRDDVRDLEVEAAPLERVSADLLQVHVPRGSRLAGVEVGELRLPTGASVSLVVRDGTPFVPHRTTRLVRGDDVLVVATRDVRELTEQRLLDVGRHGRLAGWDAADPASRPSWRNPSPTTTVTDPSSTGMSGSTYCTREPNCAPTSRTRGSFGSSVSTAATRGLTLLSEFPIWPARNPRRCRLMETRFARPARLLAL